MLRPSEHLIISTAQPIRQIIKEESSLKVFFFSYRYLTVNPYLNEKNTFKLGSHLIFTLWHEQNLTFKMTFLWWYTLNVTNFSAVQYRGSQAYQFQVCLEWIGRTLLAFYVYHCIHAIYNLPRDCCTGLYSFLNQSLYSRSDIDMSNLG